MPGAIGVTTPVELFIVATDALLDDHEPPETVELKLAVPFMHMFCVPDNEPALGAAVTVKLLVAVALLQPPVPKIV